MRHWGSLLAISQPVRNVAQRLFSGCSLCVGGDWFILSGTTHD